MDLYVNNEFHKWYKAEKVATGFCTLIWTKLYCSRAVQGKEEAWRGIGERGWNHKLWTVVSAATVWSNIVRGLGRYCDSEIYAEEMAFRIIAVDLQRLGHCKWKRGQALSFQWHKMRVVTANELLQLLRGNLHWHRLGHIKRHACFRHITSVQSPVIGNKGFLVFLVCGVFFFWFCLVFFLMKQHARIWN